MSSPPPAPLKALKYPKTPHLPFSPTVQDDDDLLPECHHLLNRRVIITEKMDGGNCQLFRGKVYARTCSHPATHASFAKIKSIYPSFAYKIPDNIALYLENVFAVHSIHYDRLDSLFYLFSVLQDGEVFVSWRKVTRCAATLGLKHVPVLFDGKFKSSDEMKTWMDERMKQPSAFSRTHGPEGFVVRLAKSFRFENFERSIAKYVRPNHIQTEPSWKGRWKKHSIAKVEEEEEGDGQAPPAAAEEEEEEEGEGESDK